MGVWKCYTATNRINTVVFGSFARYKSRYRVIQEALQTRTGLTSNNGDDRPTDVAGKTFVLPQRTPSH